MTDISFIIEDTAYTLTISHFDEGSPGNISGLPEDCFPEEDAEVGFEGLVEYATENENGVSTMDFEEFVKLYAMDKTNGDIRKATDLIESDAITAIIEEDCEYHEY